MKNKNMEDGRTLINNRPLISIEQARKNQQIMEDLTLPSAVLYLLEKTVNYLNHDNPVERELYYKCKKAINLANRRMD